MWVVHRRLESGYKAATSMVFGDRGCAANNMVAGRVARRHPGVLHRTLVAAAEGGPHDNNSWLSADSDGDFRAFEKLTMQLIKLHEES